MSSINFPFSFKVLFLFIVSSTFSKAFSEASINFLFSGEFSKSMENALSEIHPSICTPKSTFNNPCANLSSL